MLGTYMREYKKMPTWHRNAHIQLSYDFELNTYKIRLTTIPAIILAMTVNFFTSRFWKAEAAYSKHNFKNIFFKKRLPKYGRTNASGGVY